MPLWLLGGVMTRRSKAAQIAAASDERVKTCRRCLVPMVDGIATGQTYRGIPDFPGDRHATTISLGGPGVVIGCWKCPKCGLSVTKGERDE